jgi:hypothetical protein
MHGVRGNGVTTVYLGRSMPVRVTNSSVSSKIEGPSTPSSDSWRTLRYL